MSIYGVVIFDIVGSRKIQYRDLLQQKLNDAIENMNFKYRSILVSPITITLGDEWQLITSDPTECYNLADEFQRLFNQQNINIYAGIGIGSLSTKIYNDIRKMDGPCFHMARSAINIAKSHNAIKKSYIYSKENRIFFYNKQGNINSADADENEAAAAQDIVLKDNIENQKVLSLTEKVLYNELSEVINVLIENNEILKSKMTSKQKNTYNDYKKYGSYRNIIKAYDKDHNHLSIGGISEKLNTSGYFTIQRNLSAIKTLFKYFCI